VADYTAILSRRLVEVSDGAVELVLVHAGNQSADAIEVDFPSVDLSGQCSALALTETVERLAGEAAGPAVVLLEYSGYGYAKRGAPLWLVRGLRRVCGSDGVPLITMFHEISASNWKPWTSTFWLSPVQSYVAARLACLSRDVVTNRQPSAEWLWNRVDGKTPVHTQPVFSNVGEPDAFSSFEEREPHAVVFGGGAMKNRLYEMLRSSQFLSGLGIDRVVDLGATDETPDSVAGISVEAHGIQSASTISAHLQRARIGLLQYPVDYLTKSGIWAAYAAHGLPCLVVSESAPSDPLEEGHHFLRADPEGLISKISDQEAVGRRAWERYRAHAHSESAARLFHALIEAPSLA
jgi:hypothetical protein